MTDEEIIAAEIETIAEKRGLRFAPEAMETMVAAVTRLTYLGGIGSEEAIYRLLRRARHGRRSCSGDGVAEGVICCLSCDYEAPGDTPLKEHFVEGRCRIEVEREEAERAEAASWKRSRLSIRRAVARGELRRVR